MRRTFLILLLFFSFNSFGRTGPLKIDLLTSSPGQNLFSAFGHSAIRIYQEGGQDRVYSFGYIAFNVDSYKSLVLEGEVYSRLKVYQYQDYIRPLNRKHQSLDQLTLNLSRSQILAIQDTLRSIVKKDNGRIKHDFLKQNCVLVINEMLKSYLHLPEEGRDESTGKTYRDVIKEYTGANPWMLFYLDLLEGATCDKEISVKESFFIPYNYSLYLSNVPHAVLSYERIESPKAEQGDSLVNPKPLFGFFLVVFLIIKAIEIKGKRYFALVDNLVFVAITVIGLYLLFLMYVNQYGLKWNLNILWANPVLILILLDKKYLAKVRWVYVVSLLIWIISWLAEIQVFNYAVLPLILIVLSRLFYRNASSELVLT